jgi:predicted acylesterase/phospholipase RssA
MAASSRRTFLGALATAPVAAATAGRASADPAGVPAPAPSSARGERRALILAGGANRGAYEAGVIGGLAAYAGLRDGEPLGFEGVFGTSIGAINGFFVATAQYTKLRALWREIATAEIFRLKPQYARIEKPDSGVLTRVYQALALGLGLTKSVTGILDRDRIEAFLTRSVDPSVPVHIPLYVATTNLSRQSGQTFELRATTPNGIVLQEQNDALIAAFTQRKLRSISNDILVRTLLASAALPILIDPVKIRQLDGHDDEYVDGGVTDNVPLELARRCAARLHVILVDPPRQPIEARYQSAVDIGLGVFATMQQRILIYQALLAIAESSMNPTPLTEAAGIVPLPVEPFLIGPASPLPGAFGDFNTLADLDAAWQRGYDDGVNGWPVLDRSALRGALSVI